MKTVVILQRSMKKSKKLQRHASVCLYKHTEKL